MRAEFELLKRPSPACPVAVTPLMHASLNPFHHFWLPPEEPTSEQNVPENLKVSYNRQITCGLAGLCSLTAVSRRCILLHLAELETHVHPHSAFYSHTHWAGE